MKQKILAKDMVDVGLFSSNAQMHSQIGSWTKFMNELGQDVSIKKWKLNKKNIEKEFYRVKQIIGKTPTCTEFTKIGKYNTSTVQRKYGSWNKFLEHLGEQRNKPGKKINVGRQELIKHLKKNIYVMQELLRQLENEFDS